MLTKRPITHQRKKDVLYRLLGDYSNLLLRIAEMEGAVGTMGTGLDYTVGRMKFGPKPQRYCKYVSASGSCQSPFDYHIPVLEQ